MPDIRSIIKQMIQDGESEDVIDAVVKKMSAGSEIKSGLPDMSPAPPPKDEYTGPDTFWGGVKKSLTGEEFDTTARKSLVGFAKGTADLGATFADTAQGLASGVHSLIQDPKAHFRAMGPAFREMGQGMRDVTMNAGADPEAFGHMSGQLFGQPAFTEGLIKAPAIAKATIGAINRIPRVNQTLSSIGRTLEGTRSPNIVPTSSKGLVAGAVRGAARPVGRALQRAGERGRLEGGTTPPSPRTNIKLKGETETPHSPDSDIFAGGGEGAVRPRPVRKEPRGVEVDPNTEFTRPILETAEEFAARRRPSAFTGGPSRRNQSTPFEPRPVDTTPYPIPGDIPPGIPGEAPIVRDTAPYVRPEARPPGIPPEIPIPPIDPFAPPVNKIPLKGGRLKQNRRNQSPPYEPSVDPFAPPVDLTEPIGVGEGGPSSRYQHRPFEFGEESIGELGLPPAPKTKTPSPTEPIPAPFEPSVDPATFSPEDVALLQSRRAEIRAALEKMASGESVDPITGEITTPPRTKGPWRQSEPNEEMGFFGDEDPPSIANDEGRQFASEVEGSRYPGDEAYDLGEISPGFRQTSSMPDWGEPPRTNIPEGVGGDLHPDTNIDHASYLDSLNWQKEHNTPGVRPADLSEFVRQVTGKKVDVIGPTGEPLSRGLRPDIDVPRTIQPEEWGDWGGLEADIPTLVPDASGSHVAAPPKVRPGVNPLRPEVPPGQVSNRSMFELSEKRAAEGRISPGQEFADSIAPNEFSEDMMFTPEELGPSAVPPQEASPFQNQFDPRISNLEPAGDILEGASPEFSNRRIPDIADDTGGPGKLVRSKKEKNFPSIVPEGFGKVGGKQVGPKGASYSVKGPDGKHLGDINITPAEIAEMKAHEGGMLSHMSDEDLAAAMYEERLGEVLEKHGYSPDEPKIDIQPKTTRTKDVPLTPRDKPMPATATSIIPEGSEGMESLTDYSGIGREPRFPGDAPKGTNKSAFASKREPIDPDKDFGPGGDIKGIVVEAFRLDRDNAVDSKFRSLLPKEMRTELGPGETYKGKLQRLIGEIQEHEKMSPEQQAQRIAEMDAFNDATRGYANPMGPEIPPLDPAAIDVSKLRKGKLNQQTSPWYSPRIQQQEPDLFRKLMGQPRKKRK